MCVGGDQRNHRCWIAIFDTRSAPDPSKLAVNFLGRVQESLAPKRSGTKEEFGFDHEHGSDLVMSVRRCCPRWIVVEAEVSSEPDDSVIAHIESTE